MTEFPSQSHKSREPREVQPVVLNAGRIRKAPLGTRFRETFFQGSAHDVWGAMFWNVFMSGIVDNITDSIHEGVDTLFRGQGGGGGGYRRGRSGISRSNSINRHNPDRALGGTRVVEDRYSREDRDRQNTGVIELDSRAEAEVVLESLRRSIDQFDVVTLAEFYQLVKIPPQHTDYKFGWDDLGGAKIAHARGSYYLDLPPIITLK